VAFFKTGSYQFTQKFSQALKIVTVAAARPNFMKIAPFIAAIAKYNSENRLPKVEHILVHTGQHYDIRMSESFFMELSMTLHLIITLSSAFSVWIFY
jgi:UDP-N-acetylglucosamine 2-epimerase